MSKWQQTLQNLAEAGDAAASDILWDIRGMNESELAKYLVDNDEHVREVLGIKYLAEEGAELYRTMLEHLGKEIIKLPHETEPRKN